MKPSSVHTSTGPFGVIPLSVATSPEVQALSHRALRLYLVLLARHNAKRDGWAWSLTALANDTGIARNKVHYAIQQLADVGLVEVESGGGRASTHYRCLIPPSQRVVPTAGTRTDVLDPSAGTSVVPTSGTSHSLAGNAAVPTAGTPVVPTAGTTRQRSHTDVTEEPPYPHSEQNRAEPSNPPSPPASRGEQEASRFPLPERMRGVQRPAGAWQHRVAKPAPEVPVPRTETACAADLIKQVARDLGVRPREARKHLERQDAHAAEREREERHGPAATLTVDEETLREMRELYGWEH